MSYNTDAKTTASQIKRGYGAALNKIKKKYDAMAGALDEEYLARNREINKANVNAKNAASANYKISLDSAQKSLLDRGLSRSGEAVNTEIQSNLSRNAAFASLDSEAERARVENALSRSQEKSQLISDRLDAEAELERSMNEALRDQYNLDREYGRGVIESDREFLSERADAIEDKRRWGIENARKNFESDREYEEDKRQWEAENARENRKVELDAGELALEREKYESESGKTETSSQGGIKGFVLGILNKISPDSDKSVVEKFFGSSSSSGASKNESTALAYSPDELVKEMYKSYQRMDFSSENARNSALKSALSNVINDESIDEEYRNQVRIYAQAMGYY